MRTDNTRSLVIGLGWKRSSVLFQYSKIWFEAGMQGKNNLRFINVSNFYPELGEILCKALPTYHAFAGWDYTPSFFKKGKVSPLKVSQKGT